MLLTAVTATEYGCLLLRRTASQLYQSVPRPEAGGGMCQPPMKPVPVSSAIKIQWSLGQFTVAWLEAISVQMGN